jgi:hypothetical protein
MLFDSSTQDQFASTRGMIRPSNVTVLVLPVDNFHYIFKFINYYLYVVLWLTKNYLRD